MVFNYGASDRDGAFDWGRWLGTIDRGVVNDLPSAWRHGRASDYRPSNRAELLLMSL